MFLYNLTLSRPSGIQCAIYGNFSAPKAQEVVVSRGRVLELIRPGDNGRLQVLLSTDVFGVIRSLAAFRLTGAQRDYVIVGSDSGRIVILDYNKEKNIFVKVHQETFGRSGCRRIVPGQYVAADPKGRACIIGAVEKQKFVYVLNRDGAANLTISSPLEAHKSHNIVFSMCALDCGFDNPIFAAIELDYADADQDPSGEAAAAAQKHLTYYELDLGLNHVLRKWSDPVDNGANLLIPVPGSGDGPGGVLVCAENFLLYRNQGHEEVRTVLPRREDLSGDRGVLVVAYASHKKKAYSFFLLQSEYGDIYKATLVYEGETVSELRVKYFDTLPPCSSLAVLKTGFLFTASETGNHALYQFVGTGEDDDDVEASSASLVQSEEGYAPVFFSPRPLKNLVLVDEMPSLMPLTDIKVANLLDEEIPQIYALTGRGPRSALAVLRPGLAVSELAVSPLPGAPTAVFTLRAQPGDEQDGFIVVSFSNATLVFEIGEEVKETSGSGFLATVATLHSQLLEDGSMLQVHSGGLRHIRTDRRINEWRAPGRRAITRAATNSRQVVIALSGGELVYFEMDQLGQLLELAKKDMDGDVACLDIAPVLQGALRCRFLAVGGYDNTVRMLSLEDGTQLRPVATQGVNAVPESLLMLHGHAAEEPGSGDAGLFLHVGLSNGVLQRTEVDRITGKLSDTRQRFLGTRAPRLFPVWVRGVRSLLALSSRPWLGYTDMGRWQFMPLSYEALDHAASFASEQCPEGFVAVVKNTLRILSVENIGETFNQSVSRLRYTPRRLLVHHDLRALLVAESDYQAVPLADNAELQKRLVDESGAPVAGPEFSAELAAELDQYGAAVGAPGQWASCIRIVDPAELSTKAVLELDGSEAITSMALVRFEGPNLPDSSLLLAVGTAEQMTYFPTSCTAGYIRLYKILDRGARLELLHKTQLEGIPGALVAFKGRLLAGVGPVLRLFELGRKKLLRKCEYRQLPQHVAQLHTLGSRIYVADVQESVHFFRYNKADNKLYSFADDVHPRYITAMTPLDYDTVAAADKFGNFFVLRLPADVSAQIEEDPTGGKLAAQMGKLGGAPHKLDNSIQFHVGDTITALARATMQPGGSEVLLYGTIMGGIGAFFPFQAKEDKDFFLHLEMHMRQEHPPLAGRDHLAFRSAYFPVREVVDGDLCAQYPAMSTAKQQAVATELDRTPGEVLKKLEDMRNKIL
ncbi:CPSF A subunit region-domain-containing protein [Scenedesmus sp. NREL 46B-D3]|nr:CPSF A subunit region-domain-containing protein [Scenedesmus sp. NREL 46B-D3]